MSFLFGKSKNKHQNNALPAATREISSSHGPGSQIPAANGPVGNSEKTPLAKTPTPSGSVNNSISSLPNAINTASPEPKGLRERSDSEFQVSRHVGEFRFALRGVNPDNLAFAMLTNSLLEFTKSSKPPGLTLSLVSETLEFHKRGQSLPAIWRRDKCNRLERWNHLSHGGINRRCHRQGRSVDVGDK